MMTPMLEQARRLRRDLPLVWVGQCTPRVDMASNLVDDRGDVVLLFGRGKTPALVENEPLLGCTLLLLRLRDWGDELGAPAAFYDPLGWLACLVEFPMPDRVLVRRIQD